MRKQIWTKFNLPKGQYDHAMNEIGNAWWCGKAVESQSYLVTPITDLTNPIREHWIATIPFSLYVRALDYIFSRRG